MDAEDPESTGDLCAIPRGLPVGIVGAHSPTSPGTLPFGHSPQGALHLCFLMVELTLGGLRNESQWQPLLAAGPGQVRSGRTLLGPDPTPKPIPHGEP